MSEKVYLRFVYGVNSSSPTVQHGIVTELGKLVKKSDIPAYEKDEINDWLEWLNDALPHPPFQTSDWSVDAISWFKGSAKSFIQSFYEISVLLERNGRFVRVLRTSDPGTIVYEDDFQVVAVSDNY